MHRKTKNGTAMSKEVKMWIENFSEIENLIADLDLEYAGTVNEQ